MEFPSLVFRCPGEHFAHDGETYKYSPVNSQSELDDKLASGWSKTLVEAVAARKNPQAPTNPNVVQDNAPPTREEMEQKAQELKIKFDGRTSDAKLLKLINEAV